MKRNLFWICLGAFLTISNIVCAQKETEVKSLRDLKIAISNAVPGEVIVLAEGDYNGDPITISAKGTSEHPIIIKAKNKSKAVLQLPIKIEGDYISLMGMQFAASGKLEVFGKGCRVTQCTWNDARSGKWIRVLPGSSEIEIDHNTFQNKKISNQNLERGCQLLQIVVRNKNEQHHIHHNLFKDILKGKTGNGFETLQLITEKNPFDPPEGHCNSVIEDNLFLRCNGEAEIISVKSNGNILRRNVFRACRGSLVLRHGDDNIVTGNYFFGDGEPGSGGVRIQGTGQIVANNYFQDLGQFGLGMMDGTPDDLYIRVKGAQILFNSFINCNKTFTIGINHSKHPNGTVPRECTVTGNIMFSNKSPEKFIELVQNDQPENWIWNGNIAFGSKAEFKIDGIQKTDPQLDSQKNTIMLPTKNTPKVEYPEGVNKNIKFDLFGKKWKKNRTIGAIQFPVNLSYRGQLTEKSVGVDANN